MPPRYLAVANPGGKRWELYARELHRFWDERGVTPEVTLLPWRDLVARDGAVAASFQIGDVIECESEESPPRAQDRRETCRRVVRLESPGRDAEVMKCLLEAGARQSPGEQPERWRDAEYRKGWLARPGLLYAGFRRVLNGVHESLQRRPHLTPLACPRAIAELFDKRATAARLGAAGIPTPTSWPTPASAAQLLDDLRRRRVKAAYVKLNTGSSATGIAVVRPQDDPPSALTSVLRLGSEFFSTRRLQQVCGAELERVLQFLIDEGAVVQQAIPMAQLDGQNFDVRVVTLYGRPRFSVFRLSSQPMTNLHLGGRRGQRDNCLAAIPRRAWLDAFDHCVEAARLYPCATLGIDLVFDRGYLNHYLLEINAFGDFFPGLTDEHGVTIHRAEIEETARRQGWLE